MIKIIIMLINNMTIIMIILEKICLFTLFTLMDLLCHNCEVIVLRSII